MNRFLSVDAVAHHAIRNPQAPAISAGPRDISYGELDGMVDAAANGLRALVRGGARVAIAVDGPILHWVAVLALGRLGAISISLASGQTDALPSLAPDLVITDRKQASQFPTFRPDATWLADLEKSGDKTAVRAMRRSTDLVRIILSSGTTGRPKKIAVDHAALITRIKAGVYPGLGRQPDRVLCLAGPDTFWGFGLTMRTWWAGATVCFLPVSGGAALLNRIGGIAGSPRQLEGVLRSLGPDFMPPPGLVATVGGGRVSPSLARRLRLQLASQAMAIYGSTEAGGVAVAPMEALMADGTLTGFLLPWCEVQAVDDMGRALPTGETGQLRMRTPELIVGYLDDPDATEKHFRDGWFYPGDVGAVTAAGALRVLSRTDDLFNLGGVKVAAGDLDEAVLDVPGVSDGAVVHVRTEGRDMLVAAVVPGGAFDPDVVRARILKRLGAGNFQIRVATVTTIPRTSLGKVQRDQLRETLRDMARRQGGMRQEASVAAT